MAKLRKYVHKRLLFKQAVFTLLTWDPTRQRPDSCLSAVQSIQATYLFLISFSSKTLLLLFSTLKTFFSFLSLSLWGPWYLFQHVFVWSLLVGLSSSPVWSNVKEQWVPTVSDRHMTSRSRIGGLPVRSFCLATWKMTQQGKNKKNKVGLFSQERISIDCWWKYIK